MNSSSCLRVGKPSGEEWHVFCQIFMGICIYIMFPIFSIIYPARNCILFIYIYIYRHSIQDILVAGIPGIENQQWFKMLVMFALPLDSRGVDRAEDLRFKYSNSQPHLVIYVYIYIYMYIYIWLVVWNIFYFSIIYVIILPID